MFSYILNSLTTIWLKGINSKNKTKKKTIYNLTFDFSTYSPKTLHLHDAPLASDCMKILSSTR